MFYVIWSIKSLVNQQFEIDDEIERIPKMQRKIQPKLKNPKNKLHVVEVEDDAVDKLAMVIFSNKV